VSAHLAGVNFKFVRSLCLSLNRFHHFLVRVSSRRPSLIKERDSLAHTSKKLARRDLAKVASFICGLKSYSHAHPSYSCSVLYLHYTFCLFYVQLETFKRHLMMQSLGDDNNTVSSSSLLYLVHVRNQNLYPTFLLLQISLTTKLVQVGQISVLQPN
jgi:hypothetical protein